MAEGVSPLAGVGAKGQGVVNYGGRWGEAEGVSPLAALGSK